MLKATFNFYREGEFDLSFIRAITHPPSPLRRTARLQILEQRSTVPHLMVRSSSQLAKNIELGRPLPIMLIHMNLSCLGNQSSASRRVIALLPEVVTSFLMSTNREESSYQTPSMLSLSDRSVPLVSIWRCSRRLRPRC